jgi:hypothetical protein
MIIVKSLETMEELVSRHNQLHWDGWDVLELKRNPSGASRTDGIYFGGKWYTHRRFSPSEAGWRLPKRYV